MTKRKLSANFVKHTSKNPIQQFIINNFYSSLVSLVKPLNPKTILDAGCGEGFTLDRLSKSKVGEKLEGIEFSYEAISLAKRLFPHLLIKKGSVYNLPCKNDSFDLVVCTEVLEHLESPNKALVELLRATKKNLIISVPNEPFFMLSNLLRGKNISRWGSDPGHINYWTVFSFKNFLKNNGVEIKTSKFPFPWILILGEK